VSIAREPRYPDDYEIVSGRDIVLSSYIGTSSAEACVAIGQPEVSKIPELVSARERAYAQRRKARSVDAYQRAVTADPSKRRICACGCGGELPAPHFCGRPSRYLPGHNKIAERQARQREARRQHRIEQGLLFGTDNRTRAAEAWRVVS
jgi:hypothetical protein